MAASTTVRVHGAPQRLGPVRVVAASAASVAAAVPELALLDRERAHGDDDGVRMGGHSPLHAVGGGQRRGTRSHSHS